VRRKRRSVSSLAATGWDPGVYSRPKFDQVVFDHSGFPKGDAETWDRDGRHATGNRSRSHEETSCKLTTGAASTFGKPTDRQRQIWNLERKAQDAAFASAKPGATCESVDAAARKVITDFGLGPDYRVAGSAAPRRSRKRPGYSRVDSTGPRFYAEVISTRPNMPLSRQVLTHGSAATESAVPSCGPTSSDRAARARLP
jgi:hypothetical protein